MYICGAPPLGRLDFVCVVTGLSCPAHLGQRRKMVVKMVASLVLDAEKKRYANLAKHNGNMSDSEFEKHFPNLTKDVPFDDFVYWSSW